MTAQTADNNDDKPSRKAKKVAMPEGAQKPKRIDVKPIRTIYMTPEEWSKVPANPFQKANRAKRKLGAIEHLRHFVEEHAVVRMGVYPDGRRCKIDAHTRDDIWTNRPWLVDFIPKRLTVECYPVANDEEAAERFRRVDNRKTSKNAADDVHGSFRLNNISTESSFFQNASNIKTPLQYAYEVVRRSTTPEGEDDRLAEVTIDDYVVTFRDALEALDAIDVRNSKLKAPFITAFLLSFLKHGDDVVPFFRRVNEGTHGRRTGKLSCPIAKIEEKRAEWKGAGREKHMELVATILGALDSYMVGKFREPDYQAPVDMQKIMDVDLDVYLLRAKAKRTGRTTLEKNKKKRGRKN